jgi:hypothetical protein
MAVPDVRRIVYFSSCKDASRCISMTGKKTSLMSMPGIASKHFKDWVSRR